jgi:hypothetical protein
VFDWSDDKDAELRATRGIGFQDVVFHIERGDVLLVADHPNSEKYPNQKIFYIRVGDYVYLVPYVEGENAKFLKTIIPSRKATKQFLKGGHSEV